MNVLRKMKTYFHSCYGRYIPIKNVAIKFYCFLKHALIGNEIKEKNVSIDRKINNIKHECFTKMKTYVHICYGRYIPIQNVAIKCCCFIKHALEGNEIKEYM